MYAVASEKQEERVRSEVYELREVFKAISEFLKDIREPLEYLMNTFLGSMDGGKLAKDLAAFYKALVESGMDEQTAKQWTERYFNERLKLMPNLSELLSRFFMERRGPGLRELVEEREREEE